MNPKREQFKTGLGLIVSALGMAIGTGNIWRFPRVASQNGGGSFLIPWFIFLFLWSVPLLILEFSLGQRTRKGVVESFGDVMGKNYRWMGGFVAFVTLFIMFYYSVVTGWCFRYFLFSLTSSLQNLSPESSTRFWNEFTNSPLPLLFHFFAISIGTFVLLRGVRRGLEQWNLFLIPSLFLILILLDIRSLTLEGAIKGLNYLFTPSLKNLGNYKTWLEALSQSAWSTGAGWGLILTYAVYSRKRDNPALMSFTTGFGNNSASILAGMAVIPTVFALLSIAESQEVMASGNTGLTFLYLPPLFGRIPLGNLFGSLFFLGLSFAALSSLLSMLELGTLLLMDYGISRKKSALIVGMGGFLMGIPSALNVDFLNNQDWAWGVGLILSGFFFAILALKYGIDTLKRGERKKGILHIALFFLITPQFIAMMLWWAIQSYKWNPENFLNPFGVYTFGTALFQWALLILILIIGVNLWTRRK